VLTVLASVVIFIYGMLASMLGTIVPSLGNRLALTNVEVSYLALAQGIGLAATSVWAGALMDRSGKKIGVVLGLCASVIGLLILANPENLALSVAAMAIVGIGGSLVIVGANAIVNDVSDERKASALNILNLFVGLGGMATPFVAGNLLHSDATKVAYCGAAIATFALILTLLTPMRRVIVEKAATRNISVFGDRMLYILSLVTFLYTACEFAMWNWLPRYLIATGMPSVTALNILSLGFACGMLFGRLGAAKLLGKASPFTVTLLASIAMGVTTLIMLHTTTPAATACVVFIAGIAMAPIFPTTIAIVGKLFKQRSATAIGFAITCGFSGLVLSSPVIGWLSGPDPRGIGKGLLMMPVLSLIIVAALLVFRKALTAGDGANPA
jgi:fucose permease